MSAPESLSTNPPDRRRSERVILRVPVTVRAKTLNGESLEEETHTSVVNAHGGLFKLESELRPGQTITVVNAQTKMEQRGRVVRVEPLPDGHSTVAFEFEGPAPQFWPIVFPPADWGLSKS